MIVYTCLLINCILFRTSVIQVFLTLSKMNVCLQILRISNSICMERLEWWRFFDAGRVSVLTAGWVSARVGKPPMEEAVGGEFGVYGESVFSAFDWVMSLPDSFWFRVCFVGLCNSIDSCWIMFTLLDLGAFCDGFGARGIEMLFPNAALYRVGFCRLCTCCKLRRFCRFSMPRRFCRVCRCRRFCRFVFSFLGCVNFVGVVNGL